MLDFRLSVEATRDAITGNQPTVSGHDLSQPPASVIEPQPPVLVTEPEVMFGTAAAVSARSIPVTRRMIAALRVVAVGLRPPPPRPHYAHQGRYLERARMSREMDRL